MKLYCIELENWRRHRKIKIDFDEDTTVIYGPNETGKSTVFEALSRGFFDKSSAQAEVIKRIKPLSASGNITSTVRIEFILNETRYRVEKNFNSRRGTSLYKIEGKKPILKSQDNSADEELIKLLEASLPSSRGSKPSQWGAFQWLWASQDYRELPTDKEDNPTTSLHLETKGGEGILVTQKFQVVQNYVQDSYAQYFTKTGKTSKDSPISNIEKEIRTLQQSNVELSDKIKKVDDEKQQLEELQRQFPIFEKKLIETKEELEKARKEVSDLSSIKSDLNASKVVVSEAKRDVDDAKKGLIALEKSAEKVEGNQRKEKDTRNNYSRLEALCEQLEKGQQEIKERVEERAMKIRECEELTKDSRILLTKSDNMEKSRELENKIKRINFLNGRIEILKKKEVLITPNNKEVEKFIQNQTRIETLKESLIARGLAVDIKPGEEGSLDVKIDGEKIKDVKLTTTGTECVTVSSPRLGKVTIKARLEKAHDAKVDMQHLEERNKGALSKYSVNSIDELKELNRTQSEISNRIKESVAERKGVDERSINEINLECEELKEKYEEIRKTKRTPNAIKLNPIDIDLGKLVNKREREQEVAKNILDEAREERDKLYEELTKEKEKLARIRAEQKHISDDLENSITQEREIIREYGSIENQEKIFKSANENLNKQEDEHNKIKERYKELEEGPINRIKRMEQQIENQEQVIRQQRTSIDLLKGGIGKESLGGAYSKLSEIESRIEILNERLEKEQVNAESYKLLKEALEQQYNSALLAVVGPIQEDVKHSLSYVTGFLHEEVELNEYLFPTKLGERGFKDISLEFNDVSSGLKEVLALCVRLAVAKHLSERDSQCIVLDDPFVHVSSDRSNKMIELINNAIQEYGLQVIVFTHRQMEFTGLKGKMVDIQSVK